MKTPVGRLNGRERTRRVTGPYAIRLKPRVARLLRQERLRRCRTNCSHRVTAADAAMIASSIQNGRGDTNELATMTLPKAPTRNTVTHTTKEATYMIATTVRVKSMNAKATQAARYMRSSMEAP